MATIAAINLVSTLVQWVKALYPILGIFVSLFVLVSLLIAWATIRLNRCRNLEEVLADGSIKSSVGKILTGRAKRQLSVYRR